MIAKRLFSVIDNVSNNTRSKKPKLSNPLQLPKKIFVSASQTKNYILKDSLVDWLIYKSKINSKVIFNSTQLSENRLFHTENKPVDFNNFIMEKGNDFETEIVKYLNTKIPIVFVSKYYSEDGVKKTLEYMKQGVPIIHSAPVINKFNNTGGVVDLLVRSDYINQIVNNFPNTLNLNHSAPKLNQPFHYIVIDIKFTTLPLKSDGIHILNSGKFPAYKSQVLIYTKAVGCMQGYTSRYGFILGRRNSFTNLNSNFKNLNCTDRLGVIDYIDIDKEYITRTNKAVAWVRKLNLYGSSWSVSPPSVPELYPNMCIDSGIYNQEKERIAKDIGELTLLWQCGFKHRHIAFKNGIKSFKDSNCSSSALGIKGKRAINIDNIIKINQQQTIKITPNKIVSNIYNWKQEDFDFYVDFETIPDILAPFSDLPYQKETGIIFMIGVGYIENNNWNYISFVCKTLTINEEFRIMNEFSAFINSKNGNRLFYWSAENKIWNIAKQRQIKNGNSITTVFNWADLSNLFREEPISILGCFNYNLKNIVQSMRNNGLINTIITSNCNSGTSAIMKAIEAYKNQDNNILSDIILYNEFDCRALYDILVYLRKNYC